MAIVAGADFGTQSVRVTLMDTTQRLPLGTASKPLSVMRSADEPLMAMQSHDEHMRALAGAVRAAIADAGIAGEDIEALACDTTGSTVLFVDERLKPIYDYYLWCDHRAHREALEITSAAREQGLEALNWCGGSYSQEWGYAKLLHFLRHNPDRRDRFGTAIEHCDMVAATLCGITRVAELPRSACAMGHKWMWGEAWGGLPSQAFLTSVDPLLEGVNERLGGRYSTSAEVAGHLSEHWASQLGLRAGIVVPVGALDAHWDAIGSGCQRGDIVNVVGTSTCFIALADAGCEPIEGVSGLARGSVHPALTGIEAGQAATGDLFDAIARRAGTTLAELSDGFEHRQPAGTGLLRVPWDAGDRTVLGRSDLGGITLGWHLDHDAADELHAAIEGMALHARIIIERMRSGGVACTRVINAGGIPQRSQALNQIYADVLGCDVLVPRTSPVGVGACIMAGAALGAFESVEAGQALICPEFQAVNPRPAAVERYADLFDLFEEIYFGFGNGQALNAARVLPALHALRH